MGTSLVDPCAMCGHLPVIGYPVKDILAERRAGASISALCRKFHISTMRYYELMRDLDGLHKLKPGRPKQGGCYHRILPIAHTAICEGGLSFEDFCLSRDIKYQKVFRKNLRHYCQHRHEQQHVPLQTIM